MESQTFTKSKNPSREECEDIIKRILMTEVLEKGTNEHFKTAADFMSYFESLYPASNSLTKQVQRAVKSLNMPKDAKGYFIINKSQEQIDQENEISFLLKKTKSETCTLNSSDTLFLKMSGNSKDYLYQLISSSVTFQGKYETILNSSNGLIFFTNNKAQLEILINSLINY